MKYSFHSILLIKGFFTIYILKNRQYCFRYLLAKQESYNFQNDFLLFSLKMVVNKISSHQKTFKTAFFKTLLVFTTQGFVYYDRISSGKMYCTQLFGQALAPIWYFDCWSVTFIFYLSNLNFKFNIFNFYCIVLSSCIFDENEH